MIKMMMIFFCITTKYLVTGTQRRELILYEFSVGFKYYRLLSYYKLLSCDPGMYGYQE